MKKLHAQSDTETLQVVVRGRVQGVGFRAATVREAHTLGVRGWVRNLEDGRVEALIQGPADAVDRMLSWLHQGPRNARVESVDHETIQTDRYFDRFEQI